MLKAQEPARYGGQDNALIVLALAQREDESTSKDVWVNVKGPVHQFVSHKGNLD